MEEGGGAGHGQQRFAVRPQAVHNKHGDDGRLLDPSSPVKSMTAASK